MPAQQQRRGRRAGRRRQGLGAVWAAGCWLQAARCAAFSAQEGLAGELRQRAEQRAAVALGKEVTIKGMNGRGQQAAVAAAAWEATTQKNVKNRQDSLIPE